MKILVTGATGFIGSKLIEQLLLAGHEIIIVTRNKERATNTTPQAVKILEHNLTSSIINDALIQGVNGVIHLMGESIATRWSQKEKEKILNSRVNSTKNLVKSIHHNMPNCEFVISASAVGLYRQSKTDADWLDEKSESGDSFLAEVVSQWESAWIGLNPKIRKTIFRFGLVIGSQGGMLQKILPLYRAGLGGKLGSGEQWMSWIHIDDLCNMLQFAIDKKLSGTFNAVASNPIKNKDFNKDLGEYVHRPAFAHVPTFALKLVMGEASILALDSQRVTNKKIIETGFNFKYPEFSQALKSLS